MKQKIQNQATGFGAELLSGNRFKRQIFLTLTLLLVLNAPAQILTPSVIASTGGFSVNGNGSLCYTVGEMAIVKTFSAGNNILTQGFQQPDEDLTGLLEMAQDDFGSFVVYPNPAVESAFFGFRFPERGKLTVDLYNTLGQKLHQVYNATYSAGNIIEPIATTLLAPGTYLLSLNFKSDVNGREQTISRRLEIIK